MDHIVLGCRCLIGVVFLLSATSKLRSRATFGEFVRSLKRLRLLPPRWVRPVAGAVAVGEATVPLLLANPLTTAVPVGGPARAATLAGFTIAGGLLTGFTGAVLVALRTGKHTPCRCFGPTTTPLGVRHMIRNGLLTAATGVALAGVLLATPRPVHPGAAALAVAIGTGVALLVVFSDTILELLTPTAMLPAGTSVGDFSATTTDDELVSRDLVAGPTLVGFFAPTCDACKKQLPHFVSFAGGMPHRRVQALAVVVGDIAAATEYVTTLTPVARVVVEPRGGPVARAFAVHGFPVFGLIRDGGVVLATSFELTKLPTTV